VNKPRLEGLISYIVMNEALSVEIGQVCEKIREIRIYMDQVRMLDSNKI